MSYIKKSFVFLGLLSLSTAALASSTPITQCGAVINQPGDYHLDADLDCSHLSNPIAIRILNTTDVKLELRGHYLKGRPNAAYGGQGTGVYVVDSSDVEIDGSNWNSRIFNFATGIRFLNSPDGKIDGDLMRINHNTTGVSAYQSDRLDIQQLRLGNKQRDIYANQSDQLKVRRTFHPGVTGQGILVAQSTGARLKDVRIGHEQKVTYGVIFYQTTQSRLEESEIDRADVGVQLNGAGTTGILLEDNEFGDDVPNQCDYQSAFGADYPELDDNEPSNLNQC